METAARTSGFPETYERLLVPAIFAPWAEELLERTRPIGAADRILDLGCGTGIVARLLRARLGGGARITGVDINAEMIALARTLAPDLDWREGNAQALPFADASFELCTCQQMLQFVPDRAAALREIRRVLVPGGRLVAATWRPRHEQPLHDLLGRIAEARLGVANEKRFSLASEDVLCALFEEAGFSDVRIQVVTRTERYAQFPFRLNALAANFDLSGLAPEDREARLAAIEAESERATRDFVVDGAIAAPARANFITATANGVRCA